MPKEFEAGYYLTRRDACPTCTETGVLLSVSSTEYVCTTCFGNGYVETVTNLEDALTTLAVTFTPE